jgi:hypothetical protein
MANLMRHGPAGDELAGAPFLEMAGAQPALGFGLDILGENGCRLGLGYVPGWLGPFPAILDHHETHVGPLLSDYSLRLTQPRYGTGNETGLAQGFAVLASRA